jgi:Domain of unknown function (DUF4440)
MNLCARSCSLRFFFFLAVLSLGSSSVAAATAAEADKSFVAAVSKADKNRTDSLLDGEFTWTDRTGQTREKAAVLRDLASLARSSDTDVIVAEHGKVVLIRGRHAIPAQQTAVRFARVWVQRPSGWRLLAYQETTQAEKTPEKRAGFGSPSGGAPVSCDNPCKTVPYKPAGAAEQEIVSMWQAVERTVLTNDVDAWIPNFTDDFLFVTPDGGEPLNKADRVAMIKELKRTNTTLIPAEVVSMKVWVLGDSAVMRSEHKPLHGRVLHVTRVFVKQAGHWQIAFGQQTWVEGTAPGA